MENEKTAAEKRAAALDAAKVCVCTDRVEQYGTPEFNFGVIADLWRTYICASCFGVSSGLHISETDVANMMILLKVARSATAINQKTDTYVDIAGYAACAAGMIDEEGDTE